jgi:hypothetical protein
MRTSELISIGLFTAAVVLSVYALRDRLRASISTEGFANPSPFGGQRTQPTTITINTPMDQVPDKPTDADAVLAHKTLLVYTSQNLEHGVRFLTAIGEQFFEPPFAIRTDINPATLMNNYINPLQKI